MKKQDLTTHIDEIDNELESLLVDSSVGELVGNIRDLQKKLRSLVYDINDEEIKNEASEA